MDNYLFDKNDNIQNKKKDNQDKLFCLNCDVSFNNNEEYKEHYKSEFHEYNLKRKINGLKNISYSEFLKKLNRKQEIIKNFSKNEVDPNDLYCSPCSKKFLNRNTFNEHLKSKKHIKNTKKNKLPQKKININDIITFKEDKTICLFCNKKSNNFEENLIHMDYSHQFFIIDKESCIDIEGLLKKIYQLMFDDFVCYNCGYQNFKNGFSVQQHKKDLGHCFMNPNNLYLFDEFYDYTEVNQKYLETMLKKTNKYKDFANKIEIQIAEESKKEVKENEENEDDWVDVSSNEEEEEEKKDEIFDKNEEDKNENEEENNKNKNYIKIFNKKWDPKKKINFKKILINKIKVMHTGELYLPSGKIIGHRMYKRYYKQRKTYRDNTHLINMLKDKGFDIKNLNILQKTNSTNNILDMKRNLSIIDFNRKMDKVNFKYETLRRKRELNKNKRHNKVLTTYFRDSTIVY